MQLQLRMSDLPQRRAIYGGKDRMSGILLYFPAALVLGRI